MVLCIAVELGCIPNDHLQQIEWFAISILLQAFVVRFSDGLVCLDKFLEDLHHRLLLDVAQTAVIKQGLQSLSSARWLLQLQQQLILVCWREVYLHSAASLQHI